MGLKRCGGAALWLAVWVMQGCAGGGAKDSTRPRVELKKGSAVLIVDFSLNGVELSDEALRRRVRTHAVTLGSATQVRAAMGKAAVRQTRWFEETGDADERAGWLCEHLRAEEVAGTGLIQLEVDGMTDAYERATVLEALVEGYLERLKSERTALLLDRTAVLNNLKIKAEIAHKELVNQIRDRGLKINSDGGGPGEMKKREMEALLHAQIEAQLNAGRALADYHAAQAATTGGKRPAGVEDRVAADPRIVRLRDQLDDARIALDSGGNAAEARRKVDAIQSRLQAVTAELLAVESVNRLASLKESSEAEMSRLEGISKRVDNLKMDLGEIANLQLLFEIHQEDAARARERIGKLKEEIDQIMAVVATGQMVDVRWHLHPE